MLTLALHLNRGIAVASNLPSVRSRRSQPVGTTAPPVGFYRIVLGAARNAERDCGVRKKPASLIYDVEEHPPLPVALVLALQHVVVISVGWIFVVVVISGIGGTAEQAQGVIRMAMIASGVATILQAMTNGPVGSGYLCPFSCGPAYIPASILAGKAGGLPLLMGMTTASGVFEMFFSRIIHKLRVLFPPEVTGLVVAMVGIALIRMGCTRFFGYANGTLDEHSTIIALVTLTVMVTPTIWSKSKLRLYPVLLGLIAGYAAALGFGILKLSQFRAVLAAPLVGLPHRPASGEWTFSVGLLGPFLIASLSSVLKSVGDLTLCQKINDTHWKRTDMKSVAGGILAGSVGTTLAGLIGGVGQSTFSSNVGLSMATGVTSRAIAIPAGSILIGLAFFPKLAAAFSVIPAPVMGAVLVYVACFMILGGLQVMTSRMLDVRRTFAVGIAMIFGLSVDMVPGLYEHMPSVLQPLFSSELSLATVLGVMLNLLFRIGVAKSQTIELSPESDNLDTILTFMEERGGSWGMRKEVEERAAEAIYETVVSVGALQVSSPVSVRVRFDEFKLEVDLAYDGRPIQLPEAPPTAEELSNGEQGLAMLSGYIIRQHADHVRVSSDNRRSRVHLQFDH